MALKPWTNLDNAVIYTFLGFFGTIILAVVRMGWGFDHDWEVFTGSTADPKHPHQTASICYTAAVFYAFLMTFCGCQLVVHSRVAKGGDIRL